MIYGVFSGTEACINYF